MKLVLCPRCELNYMSDTEQYCKVCQRELHGDSYTDEVELCSVCNEAPALPGRDVCLFCLKEMSQQPEHDGDQEEEHPDSGAVVGMESVGQMDEILPEVEDEDAGFAEMGDALSLESVREEEEQQQDEADAEDEEI